MSGVVIPEVGTERLVLRGFHAEDLAAHRAEVDDDAAVTWAHRRLPLADSLRRWADRLDGWERDGYGMWIVELRATGKIIGHAGLQRLDGSDDVELGYYLGRSSWGQGYATEAAQALLDFGLTGGGLHRITATCDPENAASARVLEKIGMTREGRLHDHFLIRGEWRDRLLYAALAG